MIVGLSGLARCGKDSFFNFSKELFDEKYIKCKRLAFADELKKELDSFLQDNFRISSFTESTEEKEIIRPIMVSYGMAKRQLSNGLYWIAKIEKQLNILKDECKYHFITDVRFPNEIQKIKDMNGISIHITRDSNLPPNEEEALNDPIVKKLSDYNFYWENFDNVASKKPKLLVEQFLKKIL